MLLLLAVAAVTSKVRTLPDGPLAIALVALLAWLVAAGPLRVGFTLESIRMPLVVLVAYLTVRLAAHLNPGERATFLAGVVVLGCLHAVFALGELAVALSRGLSAPSRSESLLGSPNGLGMLLVATAVLSAYLLSQRGRWLLCLALLLQGGALLATGSRTAIGVGAVMLVWFAYTRPGWPLKALAAAVLLLGSSLVAWRFATEPLEQRPHLWQEAFSRIVDSPLMGQGPTPAPFLPSVPDARVTTHAHNELLQWGVEYGLIGVALGVLVLWIGIRRLGPLDHNDRWVLVAAAALLVAGLADFTLRIPALAVLAAALVTLGLTDWSPGQAGSTRQRPPGDVGPAREGQCTGGIAGSKSADKIERPRLLGDNAVVEVKQSSTAGIRS